MEHYKNHERAFVFVAPNIVNKDPKFASHYKYDRKFYTDDLINNVKKNTEVKDELKIAAIDKVKEKIKAHEEQVNEEMKNKKTALMKNYLPGGCLEWLFKQKR